MFILANKSSLQHRRTLQRCERLTILRIGRPWADLTVLLPNTAQSLLLAWMDLVEPQVLGRE